MRCIMGSMPIGVDVEEEAEGDEEGEAAAAEIDHLRASGGFLVGRTGLFSREFLRTIGTVVAAAIDIATVRITHAPQALTPYARASRQRPAASPHTRVLGGTAHRGLPPPGAERTRRNLPRPLPRLPWAVRSNGS